MEQMCVTQCGDRGEPHRRPDDIERVSGTGSQGCIEDLETEVFLKEICRAEERLQTSSGAGVLVFIRIV